MVKPAFLKSSSQPVNLSDALSLCRSIADLFIIPCMHRIFFQSFLCRSFLSPFHFHFLPPFLPSFLSYVSSPSFLFPCLFCIFSHHLVHNLSLFHSLPPVLFLRRITVRSNSLKKMLKKLRQRPSQQDLQLKRYVSELHTCYNSSFANALKTILSPQILTVFYLFSLICNRELLPRSRRNNLKVCNFLLFFYPCCCMLVVSILCCKIFRLTLRYLFKMATLKLPFDVVDLQKNLDMEKKKFEKVKETLTKTEEELKDLKKVCSFCFSICYLTL